MSTLSSQLQVTTNVITRLHISGRRSSDKVGQWTCTDGGFWGRGPLPRYGGGRRVWACKFFLKMSVQICALPAPDTTHCQNQLLGVSWFDGKLWTLERRVHSKLCAKVQTSSLLTTNAHSTTDNRWRRKQQSGSGSSTLRTAWGQKIVALASKTSGFGLDLGL